MKVRAIETFKNKLDSKENNRYINSSIVNTIQQPGVQDEPDRIVNSDVDSGRESASSTMLLMEDEVLDQRNCSPSPLPSTVKVVGELLKKDVKCPQPTDSLNFDESLLNEINLSSLIIAKDLVIGGPPFTSTNQKLKKKPMPDVARKKRVQRVAEHIENKQKVMGALPPTKLSILASPVDRGKPKEVKPLVRRSSVVRSNSKDSVNGIAPSIDKKKKLSPKLSLDSKAKDIKKETKAELKKIPKMSSVTTVRNRINTGKPNRNTEDSKKANTAFKKSYELAVNRKENVGCGSTSLYKDLDEVFTSNVTDSSVTTALGSSRHTEQVNFFLNCKS